MTTYRSIAASILRQARFMQQEHGLDLNEGIRSTFQSWAEGEEVDEDEAEIVARLLEGKQVTS